MTDEFKPSTAERPKHSLTVLVVDDEPNIRKMLATSLATDGHRVATAATPSDAIAQVRRQAFDVALVDVRLGADSGLDLLPKLLAENPALRVIIITAYASVDTAIEAIRRGAADYLPKPFTPAQVRLVIERVARVRALEERVTRLQAEAGGAEADLESCSPVMRKALDLARQVAASNASVLICGQSGTGKGVLARAIHAWSDRAERPLSVVSCPAISPQLLESELFGHVKGAFTGAVRDNPGRIAATAGGTLFLDEIGDLPLNLQPKLLRFVQDREYERVGDNTTRRADVRLIAATNVDLQAAVAAGRFREDLLYRINVIQIDLPPLRQRAEDILPLAERFLAAFSHQARSKAPGRRLQFTQEAAAALRAYAWPGNVRELRNVIERAAILCRGESVGVESFPFLGSAQPALPAVGELVSLDALEEAHIRRVLLTCPSLDEAARVLGIDVATLYRRRKKYAI